MLPCLAALLNDVGVPESCNPEAGRRTWYYWLLHLGPLQQSIIICEASARCHHHVDALNGLSDDDAMCRLGVPHAQMARRECASRRSVQTVIQQPLWMSVARKRTNVGSCGALHLDDRLTDGILLWLLLPWARPQPAEAVLHRCLQFDASTCCQLCAAVRWG